MGVFDKPEIRHHELHLETGIPRFGCEVGKETVMRLVLTFALIITGAMLSLLSDQRYLMVFGAGVALTMLVMMGD